MNLVTQDNERLTFDRSILPPPDANLLQDKDLDFLLLPILVYTTAFALVYVLCIVIWVLVLFWGNAFHKVMTRIISHFFRRGYINWGEWALSSILNFPKIASVLLIAIAMGTCGAIALLCGFAVYLGQSGSNFHICAKEHICKFYEDILEEMLKYPLKIFHRMQNWALYKKAEPEEEGEDLFSRLYFHSTLFVMWLLLTVLHFPCALVWVNNVMNNSSLRPDPSFPSAVIVCGCAAILWQKKVPNMKVKHFQVLMYGLYMLSCLVLVYASWSTYRTGVFIHMSFILVTVFQSILVEHSSPEDNLGLDEAIGDEEKEEKQVEEETESLEKDKNDSPGNINETSYLDKEKVE
ncbi:hypothetical protein J437_LFUL008442 [Ladona fulva]|uniref:Transmembrane protein n=1 Tax=Ladona fulva TaxID=123851 RepID=A0A8K0P1G1_LADFU|nr:hypothetical protein J437_LFUL008442 [Ladona fulva]